MSTTITRAPKAGSRNGSSRGGSTRERPVHNIASSSNTSSSSSLSSSRSSGAPSVVAAVAVPAKSRKSLPASKSSDIPAVPSVVAASSSLSSSSRLAIVTSSSSSSSSVAAARRVEPVVEQVIPVRDAGARMAKLHESMRKMLLALEQDVIKAVAADGVDDPTLKLGLQGAHAWTRKSVAQEIETIAQETRMVLKLEELDQLAVEQPELKGKRIRIMSAQETKTALDARARAAKQHHNADLRRQAEALEREVAAEEQRFDRNRSQIDSIASSLTEYRTHVAATAETAIQLVAAHPRLLPLAVPAAALQQHQHRL